MISKRQIIDIIKEGLPFLTRKHLEGIKDNLIFIWCIRTDRYSDERLE
ncbi:hypothetical protein [Virgibacillus necropolis]|nr:hypothetical protein [Virgibacillus necropolis]